MISWKRFKIFKVNSKLKKVTVKQASLAIYFTENLGKKSQNQVFKFLFTRDQYRSFYYDLSIIKSKAIGKNSWSSSEMHLLVNSQKLKDYNHVHSFKPNVLWYSYWNYFNPLL